MTKVRKRFFVENLFVARTPAPLQLNSLVEGAWRIMSGATVDALVSPTIALSPDRCTNLRIIPYLATGVTQRSRTIPRAMTRTSHRARNIAFLDANGLNTRGLQRPGRNSFIIHQQLRNLEFLDVYHAHLGPLVSGARN